MPALDVAIVTLTNASPIGAAETLNAQFMDLVKYGPVQRDYWSLDSTAMAALMTPQGSLAGKKQPAHATPARPARVYTGTYRNAAYGTMRAVKRPSGESANPGSTYKVRFRQVRAGHSHTMLVEYFDPAGLGTFRRR